MPASTPTPTLTPDAITLLRQVCEDAAALLACNCSYTVDTTPEDRCDGTCTHSMAKRGLAAIDALATRTLTCDMVHGCTNDVTYIDRKGYVYCTAHAGRRPGCRPLLSQERRRLERGGTVRY